MIEKYKRSQYLKEYNEITQIYNRQMKPLKNPFLIAFVAILTVFSTLIFLGVFDRIPLFIYLQYGFKDTMKTVFGLSYLFPGTYFIRLRQVIRHKNRRLKNLEEKKSQAISGGIYDADA